MQYTVAAYTIGIVLILGYAAVTLVRLIAASVARPPRPEP